MDRDDWARVRTLLAAPERKQRGWSNGNARKYELSGSVRCAGTMPDGSVCGHVMVSMTASRLRGPSFICSRLATGGCGQMRIAMEHLERYVEAQAFARVDTPELRAALASQGKDVDETEKALRTEVQADEVRLRRLTAEYDDDEITQAEYRRRRKRLTDRLDANQRALRDATRSRVHVALPSGNELRTQWPHKDNVWKRTILSALIERIDISRHPAGMASNLTPRRDEPEGDFKIRLERHRIAVLRKRVSVQWWQ